jgi:predicted ATPase
VALKFEAINLGKRAKNPSTIDICLHSTCSVETISETEVNFVIKKLTIIGFKAIKQLEIIFTPFTVLIGGNSCGKSTVLQALDFARAFTIRDINEYLLERGWVFDDLKSQFDDSGIVISMELSLNINGKLQNISYSFAVSNHHGKIVTGESIRNLTENKTILARDGKEPPTPDNVEMYYLKSSFLKLIDENIPSLDFPEELYAVKKFFAQSSSYELLSPDRMREKGSRGEVNDIGLGGEKLAAYIDRIPSGLKNKFDKILSDFIGYSANITTEKKLPGWVDLFLNETFFETITKVKSTHISDGLLRLIALTAASIPKYNERQTQTDLFFDIPDAGFILLDEIEDGINLNLIEKVIDMLRETIKELNKQVVVTTHSPAIADSFKPEEIIYMWRDSAGQIQAKPMFSTEQMKRTLRALSPGEVWINYDNDEILRRLSPETESNAK